MTYCLGIKTTKNIIMLSDSRTSAGIDNVSTYSKMWRYGIPGERQFVICSAGNLATTQAVIAQIERDLKTPSSPNLNTVSDLNQACDYVGNILVDCQSKTGGGPVFEATLLLAGEIKGAESGLYMIYSQGNFISSSSQVPFLQIGEIKYGKPILDRVIDENMPSERAALCGLISMDATMKSNLGVGPPIEMYMLDIGSLSLGRYRMLGENDARLRNLRQNWNHLLGEAIDTLQPIQWTS